MTKSHKKSSPATNQITIFEHMVRQAQQSAPYPAGCMDFRTELCAAMSEDIRHATDEQGREISRFGVAARMSELLNREVMKSTLDNWTAPSHDGRTPDALELAAFARATGGRRAMEVMARHAGLFTLPGPEALRAEIQKLYEESRRIKDEMKKRRLLLSEVERAR